MSCFVKGSVDSPGFNLHSGNLFKHLLRYEVEGLVYIMREFLLFGDFFFVVVLLH